ncbi:MAG: malto-oligosyltrehalose synthase [Achromobacter sp.]
MTLPCAAARLQFHADFTLDDACRRVPYYAALGISHLYASPLSTARKGSTHGYDVTDHAVVNPELGGEAALRRLVEALRQHGMGLILDIVPNHMATHASNAWWYDVWENGLASPYAEWFDIDWAPADPALHNKILAPFLGHPYGQALAEGHLKLVHEDGRFRLDVYGNPYPIAPGTLPMADSHDAILATHDTGTPEGRDALHALIERQHYRLAWWKCAPEEINWRRFFEVSELVGVRVEDPEVFDAVHELTLRLYSEGLIDGVRIDHVDGLAYPIAYCARLRAALDARMDARPAALPRTPAWLLIEKILAHDETLDDRWRVHGTTGYDFMAQVGALMHDPHGEPALTALWERLSGDNRPVMTVWRDARELMLQRHFPVERNATVNALHAIARSNTATRDYSREALQRALWELLLAFPVYRTYVDDAGRAGGDVARFDAILARARTRMADEHDGDDRPLLDVLAAWLGGDAPASITDPAQRALRQKAIRRFQQLTPPLAAKSLEDTTFYQYGRVICGNAVGSAPHGFAPEPAAFHAHSAERAAHAPQAMLTTATHDHKRGEDVRARLAVLSEMPVRWRETVLRWFERHDGASDPEGISGGDRYMLYQTLIGAWPLDLTADDPEGLKAFGERVAQWQLKSVREAKLRSSWISPDEHYEKHCQRLLDRLLNTEGADSPASDLAAFVREIAAAGAINSLTQTVLRLTSPGIPDNYQGTEFWDFSLVDPDNRRPVDFEAREAGLKALQDGSVTDATLLRDWHDGRIKQAVWYRVLQVRRAQPALFERGRYIPLHASGTHSRHVLAFARVHEGETVIVVVPRLAAAGIDHATPEGVVPAIDPDFWGDTTITLPQNLAGTALTDVINCCDRHVAADGVVPVASLLADWPVAVLTRAK